MSGGIRDDPSTYPSLVSFVYLSVRCVMGKKFEVYCEKTIRVVKIIDADDQDRAEELASQMVDFDTDPDVIVEFNWSGEEVENVG